MTFAYRIGTCHEDVFHCLRDVASRTQGQRRIDAAYSENMPSKATVAASEAKNNSFVGCCTFRTGISTFVLSVVFHSMTYSDHLGPVVSRSYQTFT